MLVQLDNLGLIEKDFLSGYDVGESEDYNKNIIVKYGNHIYFVPKEVKRIRCGNIIFTEKGMSLFNAVNREEYDDFWEKIVIPHLVDKT